MYTSTVKIIFEHQKISLSFYLFRGKTELYTVHSCDMLIMIISIEDLKYKGEELFYTWWTNFSSTCCTWVLGALDKLQASNKYRIGKV